MGTRRRRVSVKSGRSKLDKWDDFLMQTIINPTPADIKLAAQALMDGHLVAFPTETVYGLGVDATNKKAVSRVYSVKGRPVDHPLIVHISSINQLSVWAVDIPKYAIKIAEEYWPGPATLILKRSDIAKNFITGGQNCVGIRVPSHPVTLSLLCDFEKLGGLGIAAPSANRFGALSPTTAEAVHNELGNFLSAGDLVLDGGKSSIGLESTIIDCTSPKVDILRAGAITQEMVASIIGTEVTLTRNKSRLKSPGNLASHYSPKAKVFLDIPAKPGEGFIALANIPTPSGAHRLGAPITIEQFARDLYSALRMGDAIGLKSISVILPNDYGLSEAIRDRMMKASMS
jgi:L-threonylcarbamoyladenylate synthase